MISNPKGAPPARTELGGTPLTVLAVVAAAVLALFYGLVHIRRRRNWGPKMIINTTRPANKSKAMPTVPTEEIRSAPEPEELIIETSVLDIVEPPSPKPPALEQDPLEQDPLEQAPLELPSLELPSLELPSLELPSLESPSLESSLMDSPLMESSIMDSPPMESPPMDSPPMDSPLMESPPMESPLMESPLMESPLMESPLMDSPPMEFPSFVRTQHAEEPAEQNFATLLRSIASSALTGTLLVTTRHGEKRILFRSGLVSSAASQQGEDKKDILSDKIAHLLVRQGKMSGEKREEALKLAAEQECGQLGHILVGMGVIDESELDQAMRQQAEDLISSLLLFPEGEFTFTRQELPTPGEEELALGIDFLLRAASESTEEWNRIRRNLRCGESILAQTEEGRQVLGKARLTAPQQRVLAMADGRKNIAEIAASAPMLDLEVYKFLSSMTQGSILKVTASISTETC